MSFEAIFERALDKIAALPRGGTIRPGTPEFDRDMAIGTAREALRAKYGPRAKPPIYPMSVPLDQDPLDQETLERADRDWRGVLG